MQTQDTHARTLSRVDAIAKFVKEQLELHTDEDVVDTIHAFLVLFAMNAKLVGMNKNDAMNWMSQQWDRVDTTEMPKQHSLATMPCSTVVH